MAARGGPEDSEAVASGCPRARSAGPHPSHQPLEPLPRLCSDSAVGTDRRVWRARVRAFAEGPEAARVSLDRPPAAASVSLSVKSRAAEAPTPCAHEPEGAHPARVTASGRGGAGLRVTGKQHLVPCREPHVPSGGFRVAEASSRSLGGQAGRPKLNLNRDIKSSSRGAEPGSSSGP